MSENQINYKDSTFTNSIKWSLKAVKIVELCEAIILNIINFYLS